MFFLQIIFSLGTRIQTELFDVWKVYLKTIFNNTFSRSDDGLKIDVCFGLNVLWPTLVKLQPKYPNGLWSEKQRKDY